MSRKDKRRYVRSSKFTADRTPPTMETAIKSMPDHLRYLDPPEWAAACEISETRQRYHAAWKDKHRPSLGERIEGAPAVLLGGPFGKFEVWMDRVVARHIPLSAVYEMLDGLPPWAADKKRERWLGISAGWLIEALRMYVNLPDSIKRETVAMPKSPSPSWTVEKKEFDDAAQPVVSLLSASPTMPASKPARKIP